MKPMSQSDTQKMQEAIQACTNCHSVCTETLIAGAQSTKMTPALTGMLLDCAEMCQTAANSMMRGSAMSAQMCGVCATVCSKCADMCAQTGDPQMLACAESCRRCAEACQQMTTVAMA
jgi:hypothetical protein